MQLLRPNATLRIVGRQRQEVKEGLIRQYPGIELEWIDAFVSDAELSNQFRVASLVVAPYRIGFARDGGASGVLLDALAHGKPLLTTEALADQLPAGYPGAVVVKAEDAAHLAEGIEHSLRDLPTLTPAASAAGPAYIDRHHSFKGYVEKLLGTGS
jgi:glycosyltransferase involved in cell wall biosynthesis